MAKETFKRDKPHVNVGTIGHVDHGKTTLTAAITNILAKKGWAEEKKYDEIDAAPEEKERGITINTAHVSIRLQTVTMHTLTVLVTPTMLRTWSQVLPRWTVLSWLLLLLTVLCHKLMNTSCLARQVGVPHIVVFMNKVDLVDDPELLELVEMEIRELLTSYGFDGDNTPIIQGSATGAFAGEEKWVDKIEELMDAVDSYIPFLHVQLISHS